MFVDKQMSSKTPTINSVDSCRIVAAIDVVDIVVNDIFGFFVLFLLFFFV